MVAQLNTPITEEEFLIQELVLLAFSELWNARKYRWQTVSIFQIQVKIAVQYSYFFTWKQVRNALFRLRSYHDIRHIGRARYAMGGLYD